MASVHKMNELSGPDGEWAKQADEKVRKKLKEEAEKDTKKAKVFFMSLLIATFITFIPIYLGHTFFGIAIGLVSLIAGGAFFSSDDSIFGFINAEMTCPHCHKKGQIRTKSVTQKKGISGGKATAAILTGGWSLLPFGLSREEKTTQAHCISCKNTWTFN
jgi:hypothetical protein